MLIFTSKSHAKGRKQRGPEPPSIGKAADSVEAITMDKRLILQQQTPLLDAIAQHVHRQADRWHTPGHKGRWTDSYWKETIGQPALDWDVTELDGLDNLHQPNGPIAAAEKLAAELYGGDRAFFLVNGASAGLQAVLLSLTEPGPVLLPRHVHRALVSGLVLSDRTPRWLQPDRVGPWQLPVGPGSAAVRDGLRGEPPALAVFIHPTYHGYTTDLSAAIAACHEANVPVLVDAAHGPHLRFHDDLPTDPLQAGADAAVYSFHKTLGAFTGASVLVVRKGRLNPDRIQAALTLVQTSSPSYLLLASLDAARREAAQSASENLAQLLPALNEVRQAWRDKGIIVADNSGLPPDYDHDPTKLVFAVTGMTGAAVATALHQRNVDLEMAEADYAMALVTPADTAAHLAKLQANVAGVAAAAPISQQQPVRQSVSPPLPTAALRPAEAYRSAWQSVPLAEAAGRIAAALVSVSPPGIAAIVPGERIGSDTVQALREAIDNGLVVQGVDTGEIEPTIMVVA